MTKVILQSLMLSTLVTSSIEARGPRPNELGASQLPIGAQGPVWYTTWETAKAEAKRSNRPIYFMAAAHQCGDVSGTF